MPHELVVATLFWDANKHSLPFSQMYSEAWVERLYRGVERNLSRPFEFVVFTDRQRDYSVPVTQFPLSSSEPDYGHCIEPYKLGQPMLLMGLDTVITGNIDHLADYCLTADRLAMPLDPYNDAQVCNGVGLVPAGYANIGFDWRGENDMEWIRRFNPAVIDELFPGHVVSFKGHVKGRGLGDARIVYFHGEEKPHQLNEQWIAQHWKGGDTMEDERRQNSKEFLESQGEIVQGASGWKAREAKGIKRNQAIASADRQEIRSARAKVKAEREAAIAAEAAGLKPKAAPEPKPAEGVDEADEAALAILEGESVLAKLTDDELALIVPSILGEPPYAFETRADGVAAIHAALVARGEPVAASEASDGADGADDAGAAPDAAPEAATEETEETVADEPGATPAAKPFEEMEDPELMDIAEKITGTRPPANIKRETLLRKIAEYQANADKPA